MDLHSKTFTIFFLCAFTVLVNIPFGCARSRAKRYSLRWFLYIHLPIPLIFIARTLSHIEFTYIPVLVLAAIIGQILGGKLEF
jgi:hypothetical protein